MELTSTNAEKLALKFLIEEWGISLEHQEWFTILDSRAVGESWYVVEIGVAGLPDQWIIQVYDTGECDPNYTFYSPIQGSEGYVDLIDLPEIVAEVLVSERKGR